MKPRRGTTVREIERLKYIYEVNYFESLAKCFANEEINILYGLSSEFDATKQWDSTRFD